MNLTLTLIVALLALTSPNFIVGQTTSSECSPIIERSFKKVSADKFTFYEVNHDYVLQAEFLKNCELAKIHITPKYFWDDLNPEWREPKYLVSLSDDQFTALLNKINQIKALGLLVKRGQIGLVTNVTLRLVDKYEKAFLERRLYNPVGDRDEPKKVSSFVVYFIRSVEGKISDKNLSGLVDADKRGRLKINGRWYWVDEAEYRKAVVGERGVFRAAGPIG